MKHLRHIWQWWLWRQDRRARLVRLREIRRTKAPHFRKGGWLTYDIVRLLEQCPRKFQPV